MLIRLRYMAATTILLAVEATIALFVHDRIIRPHAGDSLAVMLVYCGLRSVTPLRVGPAVAVTLAIAVGIEIGQGYGLVDHLGLGGSRIAAVALGTSFDPRDVLAYAIGSAIVLVAESINPVPVPAAPAFRPDR